MRDKILKSCNAILEISFCLLFFFVPLILTPWNYELFEYNKMMLTYGLVIVIASAWLVKIIINRSLKIQKTPLDIPILIFLLSQILSTIFSIDIHTSLFGYYSRFHGGLLSTISYILLYYALVSNFNDKKKIFKFFYVSLFSGFLVAGYGILEHYGIDASFWIQDVKNRVFSTLGQPNWLAAYLDILIFITLGLILTANQNNEKIKSFFYCFLLIIFQACLLFTKSRSGIVALAAGLAIFIGYYLFYFLINKSLKSLARLLLLPVIILILVTFFVGPPVMNLDKIGYSGLKSLILTKLESSDKNVADTDKQETTPSKPQGPALEVGGSESGAIRKIVWQGAIDVFLHYPIFGSGVETFAYSYYKYRPKAHNLVSEWDFLYNKAHNEFLNYAATTGLVGLGAYLLVIIIFSWWLVRQIWEVRRVKIDNEVRNENIQTKTSHFSFQSLTSNFPLLISLYCAYLTILITNFFGFSVVIVAIYFWLIPAFIFILTDSLNKEKILLMNFSKSSSDIQTQIKTNKLKKHQQFLKQKDQLLTNIQKVFISFTLIINLSLLIILMRMWKADTKYALGLNYDKATSFPNAYPLLKEAISLSPHEPVYYDELSYASANLAVMAFSQKENQLATQLINEALSASQRAIKISPHNVNFFKTRTKMFYLLSAINEKYNYEAIQALSTAQTLAPTDPKIAYNLAILYGRVNQKDKALEILKQTVDLKTNYREARYALGLYLFENGQLDEAAAQMQYILQKIDPNDGQATAKLKEWNRL